MKKFGNYIAERRKEKGLTLRETAKKLGITAPYLSDVEKGNRDSFDLAKLEKLSEILELTEEQKSKMMDFAGEDRGEVAPDLIHYAKTRTYVNAALRKAKDLDAGEEEWFKFIEELMEQNKDND